MRVCVTATGASLRDEVDPRFGRCPYFLIVDTKTMEVEAIENPNVSLGGGAGVQSGQLMAEKDVEAVLTGNCGPNAFQALAAAGISVVPGASGRIADAIERYKRGIMDSAQAPTVADHFGMGKQEPAGSGTPGGGMGGGRGGGMGGGRGGGMGGGRGGGMGGGRGGGMGGGRGGGMGGGRGGGIGGGRAGAVAVVDAAACNGCGLCVKACPVDAIILGARATINPGICTGCGLCVPECPTDAITIQ